MKLLNGKKIQQINGGSNYTSSVTLETRLPFSAAPIITDSFYGGTEMGKAMKDLLTSLNALGKATETMKVQINMTNNYSRLLS